MSPLLDDDDDLHRNRNDRELTLSTGAILGIFFGLVLLCALFFVFGYNMGRRLSPVMAGTASDSPYANSASANAAYSTAKPSPGSLTEEAGNVKASDETPVTTTVTNVPQHAAESGSVSTAPASTPLQPKIETVGKETPAPVVVERTPQAVPAASASGTFVVQVAAVSHQEDAELLVNALQRKGYSVAARNESGDKLVHIQVGPFSDHKEADAMRQKLITDGFYNPMIKQR